jgi:hypothetical protein
MPRVASLVLLLSLATSGLACVAPTQADDPDVSESNDEVIATGRYVETFAFRPAEEIAAKVAEFRARNGSAWRSVSLYAGDDGDRLNGTITHMRREDAFGQDVVLQPAEAVAHARAFLNANADLLGFSAADLANATFDARPVTGSDYRWLVTGEGERRQPGYEEFDTVTSRISPTVSIGRDGTVRYVSRGGPLYPRLTVATTPHRPANDALVLRNVVGRDLVWSSAPHSFVNPQTKQVRVGIVTAADVTAAQPMIEVEPSSEATTFRLVWDLTVTRGGHSWFFVVDTTAGRLLRWGQVDF